MRDQQLPGAAISGLEGVQRYWNPNARVATAKLRPGEYYIGRDGEELVTAVGSTACVCITDPKKQVAGMTHFSLPKNTATLRWGDATFNALEYGRHAIDLVIQGLIRQGARRGQMVAEVYGGSSEWLGGRSNPHANVVFARRYLASNNIEITAEDVGSVFPRKVWLSSARGSARMQHLYDYTPTLPWRELLYLEELSHTWSGVRHNDSLDANEPSQDHQWLTPRLEYIEDCLNQPGRYGEYWIISMSETLGELGRFLQAHFAEEEKSELYTLMHTMTPFRIAVAALLNEHRDLLARTMRVAKLWRTGSPNESCDECMSQTHRLLKSLRDHEQREGELLSRVYMDRMQ